MAHKTGLQRTFDAIDSGKWDAGRTNKAHAYLSRVVKSRKKAKMQKASRKRNR